MNIQELLHLAEEGDTDAIEAISRQCTALGRGLRMVTVTLAPEVILITGDIASSWARFGPIVEAELAGTMLAGTPPRLDLTKDREMARLRGAAAVVLQRHSGHDRITTPAKPRRARIATKAPK
jgi:predicted NBD/HSP70 family sugar kinase